MQGIPRSEDVMIGINMNKHVNKNSIYYDKMHGLGIWIWKEGRG